MMKAFPTKSPFRLQGFKIAYYSSGMLNRILSIIQARRNAATINHITGDVYFLALGLPSKNTILTIHDCAFMQNPTNAIHKWLLQLFWLKIPVKRSKIITVVSEATKMEVIKYTNCPSNKIRIVPTIIGDYFYKKDKTFNQDKPRILHIGVSFNKNLERHIKALEALNCHLRIIGNLNETHKQMLKEHNIDFSYTFNISNEQIQNEYAQADIMLFASTLEGFGMPIIEAQAVGTPVVTSNISSMPEVAGEAACLVDPLSIKDIRSGVLKVINDKNYREQLIQLGFENIKRFQAETVAKQYEAIYYEILK